MHGSAHVCCLMAVAAAWVLPAEKQIAQKIKQGLDSQSIKVADISGGCGAMYRWAGQQQRGQSVCLGLCVLLCLQLCRLPMVTADCAVAQKRLRRWTKYTIHPTPAAH